MIFLQTSRRKKKDLFVHQYVTRLNQHKGESKGVYKELNVYSAIQKATYVAVIPD